MPDVDMTAESAAEILERILGETIADAGSSWEDPLMAATPLSELLNLPPAARADLAIALWESLSDEQREAGFSLGPEQAAELDLRWAAHVADPTSAIPWEDVRRKLRG